MSVGMCVRAGTVLLSLAAGQARAVDSMCRTEHGKITSNAAGTSFEAGLSTAENPRRVIQFWTPLRVTTDGAPDSYKLDLSSTTPAINSICNAIAVYMVGTDGNRSKKISDLDCTEKLRAFRAFEAANWAQPDGFDISWQSGLVGRERDDTMIPCVFAAGQYRGFIASKTNLRYGLKSDRGDCDANDQIDPRIVPGITIKGGTNFIRTSGVQLGDLALVVATKADGTTVEVPAIVIDSGGSDPAMGSLALNAALSQRVVRARSQAEANSYEISKSVSVLIVSGSAGYRLKQPYTAANIAERLEALLAESNFKGMAGLQAAAKACGAGYMATVQTAPAATGRGRQPPRTRQ